MPTIFNLKTTKTSQQGIVLPAVTISYNCNGSPQKMTFAGYTSVAARNSAMSSWLTGMKKVCAKTKADHDRLLREAQAG